MAWQRLPVDDLLIRQPAREAAVALGYAILFILAAVLALAIGLITVGWQALKSANANPVEALRYE